MSELHALRDALDEVLQGSVPDDLKAKGWRYRDFNTKFTSDAWDFLLRLIGDGEYKIIAMSSGGKTIGKDDWIRGQFWISPQGYTNMQNDERRNTLRFGSTH